MCSSDLQGGKIVKSLNTQNETVKAVEVGYSYKSTTFAANLNGYYTLWTNKPLDNAPLVKEDPTNPLSDLVPANVNGLGARHAGIEGDFAYKITPQLRVEGIASIGNWIWNSKAILIKPDGTSDEFDPRGVKVGDAAQTQLGAMLRYEPIKRGYVTARTTYFGRNFANFAPESLKGANAQKQSWQMPSYFLSEFHAGYSLKVKKSNLDFRFSLLNALNKLYIADGRNNDENDGSSNNLNFDAESATVFFGLGRRWNLSVEFRF